MLPGIAGIQGGLGASSGGGGAEGGIAYRYVGIHVALSGAGGDYGYCGIKRLSMFESGNATDLCLAGTMGATVDTTGFPPSNMHDADDSTFMVTNGPLAVPLGGAIFYCDFGSGNAKAVNKVGVLPRSNVQMPVLFRLVGSSDASAWEHIAYIPTQAAFSSYTEFSVTPETLAVASRPGYRYIRMTISAAQSGGSYCAFNELMVREGAGGDSRSPFASATAESDFLAGGFSAAQLVNNSTANQGWYSGDTTPNWTVKIDFGAGNRVNPYDFGLYPRVSETSLAPKDFTLEGSNDDASYTTLTSQTGQTGWADNTEKTYAV